MQPLLERLAALANGHDDIRLETAGRVPGRWFASMDSDAGHELIAAGLLILAGPFDGDLPSLVREPGSRTRRQKVVHGAGKHRFDHSLEGCCRHPPLLAADAPHMEACFADDLDALLAISPSPGPPPDPSPHHQSGRAVLRRGTAPHQGHRPISRREGGDEAGLRHLDPGRRPLVPSLHHQPGTPPAQTVARRSRTGPAASRNR